MTEDQPIGAFPLTDAQKATARLKLKRRVAACLLTALAESGLETAAVEDRLGVRHGSFGRYIQRLMSGKTRDLDFISDCLLALGFDIVLTLRKDEPLKMELAEAVDRKMEGGR